MSTQSIVGNRITTVLGNGTYYCPTGSPVQGDGNWYNCAMMVPAAGTFSNLVVKLAVAPGAGTSRTIAIHKWTANSSTIAATTVTVTISNTATTGSDTAHSFSVNAGDKITIATTVSGSPAASIGQWYFNFVPTTDNYTILGGTTAGGSGWATTKYSIPGTITSATSSTEAASRLYFPVAGTIRNLYVEQLWTQAPGSGKYSTYTLSKNGTPQSLTCTINGTDYVGNDASNNFAVVAGDYINCLRTTDGLAGEVRWGVVFVPDVSGQFLLVNASFYSYALSNSNTEYLSPAGGEWTDPSTTETDHSTAVDAITIKGLYVSLVTAPGSGKEYVFNLRQNASSPGMSVTINGTNKAGGTTGTITCVANDLICLESDPNSTPAASLWGYTLAADLSAVGSSSSESSSSSSNSSSSKSSQSSLSSLSSESSAHLADSYFARGFGE